MLKFFKKNTNYVKYLTYLIFILTIIFIIYYIYSYLNKEKVILILSSDVVRNPDELAPYLLKDVIVVMYDYYDVNSFSEIITLVQTAIHKNNITKVKRIGIMFHTKKEYTLSLFESDKIREVDGTTNTYQDIKEYYDFLLFVKYLSSTAKVSEIDLISCRILQNKDVNIFDFFDEKNVHINLSMTDIGGDTGKWYLDKGSVDLIGLYFNKYIESSRIVLIA